PQYQQQIQRPGQAPDMAKYANGTYLVYLSLGSSLYIQSATTQLTVATKVLTHTGRFNTMQICPQILDA
ncbi:MAG: hypothetical protein Q9169_007570, partial [Polycauliona sp. 2 TL-2023]